MSVNVRQLEDVTLAGIAAKLDLINADASGKICFDTPFGRCCVKADGSAPAVANVGTLVDASTTTLAEAIGQTISNYSDFVRNAEEELAASYEALNVFNVSFNDSHNKKRGVSIGVSISF